MVIDWRSGLPWVEGVNIDVLEKGARDPSVKETPCVFCLLILLVVMWMCAHFKTILKLYIFYDMKILRQ